MDQMVTNHGNPEQFASHRSLITVRLPRGRERLGTEFEDLYIPIHL